MILAYCSVGFILLCLTVVTGFRLRTTVLAGARFPESNRGNGRPLSFYAPMERLLSDRDFRYLETRPEIPPAAIKRMRRDRRRIFRKYLSFLASDFAAITAEIRSVMVHSRVSRPDLAASLVKATLLFRCAMLAIEFRLVLHSCGVHSLNLSTLPLTASLEKMRAELRLLSPAPVFAA